MDAELHAAVRDYAARFPVPVLLAMIMAESQGEANFTRPIPNLRYVWNSSLNMAFRSLAEYEINSLTAPRDFPGSDSEWAGQRTAWGPLPIVGAVAREQGYKDAFPALCGVKSIILACSWLNKMRDDYRLTAREVLLLWYNHDPVMADTVFTNMAESENSYLLNV